MITEIYVSFEIAKLLKEKWFKFIEDKDELSQAYIHAYTKEGKEVWGCYDSDYYPCITISMAMKWLREVHKIFIEISVSIDLNGNYHYSYFILNKECKYIRKGYTDFNWNYEQACEAALKYCLENII